MTKFPVPCEWVQIPNATNLEHFNLLSKEICLKYNSNIVEERATALALVKVIQLRDDKFIFLEYDDFEEISAGFCNQEKEFVGAFVKDLVQYIDETAKA